MLAALIIAGILICLLLTLVFGVLWFLSASPHSQREAGGGYLPTSFQFSDTLNDTSALAATSVHVPDVFNESRIKADLEVLATQPTLLAQYIAQAELRFTQARQMAVLQRWTEFYKVGEEVIVARTKLVRAHHDFLQVNREGEIKAKEKDVRIRVLEAELEEAGLREAQARHAKQSLGKTSPTPEPALSAEEQRLLNKAKTQEKIARLRAEKVTAMEASSTEDENIRTANSYDDRIARLQEELSKYL